MSKKEIKKYYYYLELCKELNYSWREMNKDLESFVSNEKSC